MIPRERVLTALKLKEPDKVPFVESAIDEVLQIKLMGREAFAPYELCEYLGLDAFGYEYPRGSTVGTGEVIKSEISHERYYNPQKITFDFLPPWIAEMEIGKDGRYFIKKGLIKDKESLSLMDQYLPDPHDQRRYEKVATWIAKYKKDYAIFARIRLGTAPVINSIGLEQVCYMIYDNPNLLKEVHKRYSEWTLNVLKYLNKMDFDFYWAADDIADNKNPWFSRATFQEFFLPFMKVVADEIRKPWAFHSDGNLFPVLDDLLTLGMNAIHPIQPSAMDINRMKKEYGDKVCLIGNIDLNYTLTRGTVEEVEKEVKERIKSVGHNGGYIVSSANSLASYVLPENALALGKAVKKYGKYPINLQ